MTLDLTKLPIGTRLKTRGGKSARLLATDIVDAAFTCAVAVAIPGAGEMIETVQPTGHRGYLDETHPDDIVAIERPKHRVRVVLVGTRYQPIAYAYAEGESGFVEHDINSNIVADQIVEIEELSDA